MSNTIKPKRSYTTSVVPSGLSAGELAINAADGKVWIGSALGANVLVASLSLSDMKGSTTNITEGSNLFYTDSRSRLALSAGTGISYDNTTGVITNSSPDQTVKLTAGTGISTSGTYPNFTITNSSPDQTVVLTAGTGISTSGTYPNFTITNSSPDQTVKLTSGTGISVTGTYPNFTITNSSPSSGGTVTSVGLTAPTGMKVTGSPVTGSGTLALAMDTGYALPTTASQTNWDTAYTNRITSLTTTGSSGSATLISNTLNVPTYTLAGLGGQPSSTNLTSLSGLTYSSASFVKMTSSGTFSLDTATYLTGNQSITLSGDASGTGTTSIAVTLATVGATKGGTGQTSYALGDILYCSASNVLSKLAGNTTSGKQFLSQTGTGTASAAPAWASLASSDVTTALGFTPYNSTNPNGYTNNTGTVTSVGLSLPAIFSVTNSPVTTTGTLTGTLANQNANIVFAGPSTGAAAAPAFRSLVAADIPTLNQNTTGTAANVTGTVAIANGGTGATDAATARSNLGLGNVENTALSTWAGSTNITTVGTVTSRNLTVVPDAGTGTQSPSVTITAPAHTALTASTESNDLNINLARTAQFATGSLATQRAVRIQAPTYSFVGASTLTTAATVQIDSAPVAGTNATITNAYALNVLTGTTTGVGVVIQGPVNNTGKLQVWQSDGGAEVGYVGPKGTFTITPAPVAGTTPPSLTVTSPSYSGARPLTASTEHHEIYFNLNATTTFNNGTIATQRAVRISAPNYRFTTPASTITDAVTMQIDSAPTAGLYATLTNSYALRVLTGTVAGVGIAIQGASSQLGDLFQVQNSSSTVLSSFNNNGSLVLSPYGTSAGNTNELRFLELAANGTNYVGFKGADNIAANVIWTLPSADGTSGQVLSTNGSGTLSWSTASSGSSIPSGSMQMYAGSVTQSASSGVVTTNAPSGWLLCNGDIVSRTTYSALFTAIGTTYGAGDGSTTFALPDMRSRVPVGVGQASGLSNRTLGGTVGEENTTIGATNLPAHSHSFSPTGTLNTESSHTHASPNAGFHAHGSNVNVLCYAAGGANLNAGSTFQHYNLNQIMYGAGDHGHGNTNSNTGHTHTFTPTAGQTTGNGPGTGASLTNMQPSIGLNYIIKT